MLASSKKREYVNFDGQDYDVLVELDNGLGPPKSFNSQAIHSLSIKEGFLDWNTRGFVVFDNAYEYIERKPYEEDAKLKEDGHYKMRTDGHDIIRIRITPDPRSKANPAASAKLDFKWEIYFEGVIVDVEDIMGPTNAKLKKMYFWEKEYFYMLEKNVEFSTAQIIKEYSIKDGHNISQWDNRGRALRANEVLYWYFHKIPEYSNLIDTWGWSRNFTDNNFLFYTSPASYKMIDDVEYITKRCVDSESAPMDIPILHFRRRTFSGEGKRLTFLSLNDYYKFRLNPAEKEEMYIADSGEDFGKGVVLQKSKPANIKARDFSDIGEYSFTEMSGIDSAKLLQCKPQYDYNFIQGQFNVRMSDHTVENAIKHTDTYMKNTASKVNRTQLNTWKVDGHNLTPHWNLSNDPMGAYAFGRNEIVHSAVFNGTVIHMNLKGMTHRMPGTFFNVQKKQYNDTDFDNRLEGEYFFVQVTHNFDFKAAKYTTDFLGTKFYYFEDKDGIPPLDKPI